ncbi:hypothetical protein J1614_008082 [Plenodomus biglobosus]|nr:hypothetical protein J1614_008082 [Plenodomus biglobosus]
MQFTTFLQILAACTVVSAAPSALRLDESNALSKRADFTDVDCGGIVFDRADVVATYNQFVSADRLPGGQKPKAGTRAYPQQYGNARGIPSDPEVVAALNAIPGCETGQNGKKFFEYPLMNPTWTGSAQGGQGPHRIISIAPNVGPGGTRQFTYCLAITHLGGNGLSDPSFRPCNRV